MRRAELKTKMETIGMVAQTKKKKARGTREPRVNYEFVDWDPGKESFPCPTADHKLPSDGPAYVRRADLPLMNRGDAAGAAWICRWR